VEVEAIVVDNASADRSRESVRRAGDGAVRLIESAENVGFAAAMNLGIAESRGRYVLALNPDCRLEPDFAAVLAAKLDARPDAGSASGRLIRAAGPGPAPPRPPPPPRVYPAPPRPPLPPRPARARPAAPPPGAAAPPAR